MKKFGLASTFHFPMSQQPCNGAVLPTRRAPRAAAAAFVLALASATHAAFGVSVDFYDGCKDLCYGEFWVRASASDFVAALAREPKAASYRGHILRHAVSSGANADTVAALLRAGAPPNVRQESRYHRYVLQVAARRSAEFVSVLLDFGTLPHLADDEWRTPLHEAAKWGLTDAAAVLIAAGADPRARVWSVSNPGSPPDGNPGLASW